MVPPQGGARPSGGKRRRGKTRMATADNGVVLVLIGVPTHRYALAR